MTNIQGNLNLTNLDAFISSSLHSMETGSSNTPATQPVFAGNNSGLSFGYYQGDVAGNPVARQTLYSIMLANQTQLGLSASDISSIMALAGKVGVSEAAFTTTFTSAGQSYYAAVKAALEASPDQIAALDQYTLSAATDNVLSAIDAASLNKNGPGALDPNNLDPSMVTALASWANRTNGNLDATNNWLSTSELPVSLSNYSGFYLDLTTEFAKNPTALAKYLQAIGGAAAVGDFELHFITIDGKSSNGRVTGGLTTDSSGNPVYALSTTDASGNPVTYYIAARDSPASTLAAAAAIYAALGAGLNNGSTQQSIVQIADADDRGGYLSEAILNNGGGGPLDITSLPDGTIVTSKTQADGSVISVHSTAQGYEFSYQSADLSKPATTTLLTNDELAQLSPEGQVGSFIGGELAQFFATHSQFAHLAVSTFFATAGQLLAEEIGAQAVFGKDLSTDNIANGFEDNFANAIGGFAGGQIGSALFKDLGIDPALGGIIGSTVGGAVAATAFANLVSDNPELGLTTDLSTDLLENLADAGPAAAVAIFENLTGFNPSTNAFNGNPSDVEAGTAVGGLIGSIIGSVVFAGVGTAIGDVIGQFLGSMIGSLFGPPPSVGPSYGNTLGLQVNSDGSKQYDVASRGGDNGEWGDTICNGEWGDTICIPLRAPRPCQSTVARSWPSAITSPICGGAARKTERRARGWRSSPPPGSPKPALRRQIPGVGAVCGNSARTVLCGGRSVMSVPTAIRIKTGKIGNPCRMASLTCGTMRSIHCLVS